MAKSQEGRKKEGKKEAKLTMKEKKKLKNEKKKNG